MNPQLEEISNKLNDLSSAILTGYAEDQTMNTTWGWNHPALSRHDLAYLASSLATKIKSYNDISVTFSEEESKLLSQIPHRIIQCQTTTVKYFYNGHGMTAVPTYLVLIEWIRSIMNDLFGWYSIQNQAAMPKQLSVKLRGLHAQLEEIVPKTVDLESKIKLINEATETAESLPADLQSLVEARRKLDKISTDSAEIFGKIDTYFKDASQKFKDIEIKDKQADKLVQQCEEAYRITTTKGLAAAFDQRARKLGYVNIAWVVGLLVALIVAGLIGAHRLELLGEALKDPTPSWGGIWLQAGLSILSIGAPLWFAWIATKKINQTFRLSEDYAFKASVAKAYEGYRKEAARLDESLEHRLFSSALTRLEEPPLRFVANEEYGSPWHEAFDSEAFKKAMDTIPGFKDQVLELFRRSDKQSSNSSSSEKVAEEEK